MSFTPSAAAQATASLAGSNMATLTTPLTALQTSISGGNLAPAAYLDAIVSLCGGQSAALIDTAGSGTSLSTTPTTVASATFSAPMTRVYEFSFDVAGLSNNVAGSTIAFNVLVDGTTSSSVQAGKMVSNDSVRHNLSWRQRLSLSAGSHSIAVQAAANTGTGPFDSSTFITVYVR